MPRRLLDASSSRTLGFGLRAVSVGSVVERQIFSLGRLRWDLREGDQLEDPGADGMILKRIFENWDDVNGLDYSGSG
jgi:hypothetical protein